MFVNLNVTILAIVQTGRLIRDYWDSCMWCSMTIRSNDDIKTVCHQKNLSMTLNACMLSVQNNINVHIRKYYGIIRLQ